MSQSPDCVFCKIVAGELPSKKVLETERLLAFEDINPKAPIHVLLIPKKHVVNLLDGSAEPDLMGEMLVASADIARQRGVTDYRLVANTGKEAGQIVFHLHFHVLAGRRMTWPPG